MKHSHHARRRTSNHRRRQLWWICCAVILISVLVSLRWARAANPPSGTISSTGPTVTWTGTATGGSSPQGEDTCVEGVNCDTFTLNVTGTAADYAGKIVSVKIDWSIPADDYDLYVHKGSNTGPLIGQSANGAPSTEEATAIDPSTTGTGTYSVHVVYFTTPGPADQYRGTAAIEAKTTGRTSIHVRDNLITFSPSYPVKAPVAAADGEPSSRTDKLGNFYVSGIRGFPAGVDLWNFDLRPTVNGSANPSYDPYMRNPLYRGQPDAFSPTNQADLGGDGGGDVDLAVAMPDPNTGAIPAVPTLASSSLIAANISTQKTTDRGMTYQRNPAGNTTGGVPVDDRQWQEFYGPNSVYLLYRTLAPAVAQIQRSDDGGLTYGPAMTVGQNMPPNTGQIGQTGNIDVHQKSGTVYVSGNSGTVCAGTPPIDPLTNQPSTTLPPAAYDCHIAATDPNGVAHIFFPVKVADDGTPFGTAYVAYSNDHNIYLVHSTDKGVTWSAPVQVNDPSDTTAVTNIFPWLETGPTPGSVGIVWYGTPNPANDDNANWKVYFAQTFNATADSPTFRQVTASDHYIHASNISEGGTLGQANRNLLDYFQVSFDPTGAAVIGFTDDHIDVDGHTYVMRQISGPGINGNGKASVPDPGPSPTPQPGPSPLATEVGGIPGSQVTDFRQDAAEGLVARVNADDPIDILSIKYANGTNTSGAPNTITAAMKVSNLATVPPNSTWRMEFTANAPFTGISPTGDYSFALPDRGDQFYVQASSGSTGTTPTFTYGTTVRNSDGSLTRTSRGAADSGVFDTANNIISVTVSISKLNAFITHGAPIAANSILAGLRGQASTSAARSDLTRGGTEFTVTSATPTAARVSLGGRLATPDGAPLAGVIVDLIGVDTIGAQSARVLTDADGRYLFTDVEVNGFYTLTPQLANYTFTPASRSFSLLGNATRADFTGAQIEQPVANPLDTPEFFVRQQYVDFLAREPDQSGLKYWATRLAQCGGDMTCLRQARSHVAAAFFVEQEFQQMGAFVYRLYKSALNRQVSYAEFAADRPQIGSGVNLDASKTAFADGFVQRAEFIKRYEAATTADGFVDALLQSIRQASGVDLSDQRRALLAAYNAGDTTTHSRSLALKLAAENAALTQAEYNRAFVLMQYFGYLKRDPDTGGYNFWLDVLNNRVTTNAGGAPRMVCAFITSAEYQRRFSNVVTHTNRECEP